MAVSITTAIGILASFVLGVLVTWLLMRRRISLAKDESRNEGNAEIARANERTSLLGSELERERDRVRQLENQFSEAQRQSSRTLEESATLRERSNRVPMLEQQISTLQTAIQEEKSRSSALAEQSSRIPQLEGSLKTSTAEAQQWKEQLSDTREQLSFSNSRLESISQRTKELEAQLSELSITFRNLADAKESLSSKVAELTTSLAAEREKNPEKLALLDNAEKKLSDTFKTLANAILEENSSRFTKQNETNISQILLPLNEKLGEFKSKVEQVYVQDSNDRTALKTQITQLMSLSERVSDDAKNLTDALKGSSKTQGNWGELILESVLEKSGLRKGHEYELRETYHYEDGSRGQPDVVICLPEDRQLVVDSKVSLTDYERYTSASSDSEAQVALEAHVASVRRHIRELSEKDYPSLCGIKSLDLVVMFVPLESAFAAAIAADNTLWEEGFRKDVLLVSPSSMLFVLRTVKYLWKQEDQAQHVRDIAKCGEDLYDKIVSFIEDLRGLGRQLQKAQTCYENASKKLSEGRGNLIARADKLRQLGLIPKKQLPAELVERAAQEPIAINAVVGEQTEALEPDLGI
jgi:DNA recombination protein RmuC